jgi:SAM-dependent methyltransferase
MNELPSSPACLRNRGPILNVLKDYTDQDDHILEIGHGTGEHAVYFAKELPIVWQPADQKAYHWVMKERLEQDQLSNLLPPLEIVIGNQSIKNQTKKIYDAVFSANTLHIMSEQLALKFCLEVGEVIKNGGYLFLYGPFKFNGDFTSESNQAFDYSLKFRDPESGIRDFEILSEKLKVGGLSFKKRYDLPSHNQFLVYQKV